MSASVVINTLNRAESLRDLLIALRHQTYDDFEVVVVAGPCTDDTDQVMAEFGDVIKARWCPEPNLSMSRNIGIAATVGDVVVFIDDDAVPEPGWLVDLLALYDSEEVAGAGGVVFDHTGYDYQTRFILADRLGRAEYSDDTPFDDFCFPGTMKFPTLLGCNSSFRRDRLVEVGGFDEEFEYYLDETDVCLRLVDRGYTLRQGSRGAVHHKFLPSSVRDSSKVVLNNFPVIKNNLYFSFVNARDHVSLEALFEANVGVSEARRTDLHFNHGLGRVTDAEFVTAMEMIGSAWEPGLAAGERGRVALYDPALEAVHGGPFVRYPTIAREGAMLRIVLVTQTLPPEVTGGIGRYCLDLGRELARRGHDVRIITDGDDHNTVDFEDGVWIHRMVKTSDAEVPSHLPPLPANIWQAAAAVAEEVVRLNRLDPIDVVYAPMWDVEGVAVGEYTSMLSITALMTTMGITLRTRSDWRDDPIFMEHLGRPLVDLERWVAERAHGVHAISGAITSEVESAGGFEFDPSGVFVAPLGVVDRAGDHVAAPAAGDAATEGIEVLFVGRLEHRKGIDLLLAAVPAVLESDDRVRVTLVGRDVAAVEGASGVAADFLAKHADASWLDRVQFLGEVDDGELWDHYRTCDVFVAPSRFESFGLIFVEAMMAGRPVVALRTGAAPEVIDDGVTGLLVDPDDADALAAAVIELTGDAERRTTMGAAGRARFVERFTAERMADTFERHLRSFVTHRPGDASVIVPVDSEPIELPDGSPGLVLTADPVTIETSGQGRTTVVLWFDADEVGVATVAVNDGPSQVIPAPAGGGFSHTVISRKVGDTVSVSGTAGAFAAVHVVDGSVGAA